MPNFEARYQQDLAKKHAMIENSLKSHRYKARRVKIHKFKTLGIEGSLDQVTERFAFKFSVIASVRIN